MDIWLGSCTVLVRSGRRYTHDILHIVGPSGVCGGGWDMDEGSIWI